MTAALFTIGFTGCKQPEEVQPGGEAEGIGKFTVSDIVDAAASAFTAWVTSAASACGSAACGAAASLTPSAEPPAFRRAYPSVMAAGASVMVFCRPDSFSFTAPKMTMQITAAMAVHRPKAP